jgi:hypothetical protein
MKRLWLGHCCGILSVLYVLLFWLLVTTRLGDGVPITGGQADVAGFLACVLALVAAILSSRRWYFVVAAAAITLLFTLYANGV